MRFKQSLLEGNYLESEKILVGLLDRVKNKSTLDSYLEQYCNFSKLENAKQITKRVFITRTAAYDAIKNMPMVRPQFRPNIKEIELINDNIVLSINWALYKDILIKTGNRRLINKYHISDRVYDYNSLKNISVYMLINGPRVEKGWQYLVGIETLYGLYYEGQSIKVYEKLNEWVNNTFKPTLNGSETQYLDKFRTKVKELLNFKPGKLAIDMTLDQFCVNLPLTGTSGAAFDPGGERLTAYYDDIKLSVMNSKFAKSAKLSPQQKRERILGNKNFKANVSIKLENYPKIRLIASADYTSTIKMRFIDTWLVKWMKGNPLSTLWQTKEQTLDMWLNFSKMQGWNVPIDQTNFDHKVSKDMVQIINEEILQLIEDKAINDEVTKQHLIMTMKSIIYGLNNMRVFRTDQDGEAYSLPYNSGIISGWQWTAFYDTVANIAEGEIAKEAADTGNQILFNAQGDDQLNVFKHLYDGLMYWIKLSQSGFEIHPQKNFFSLVHNEYLRKYSQEGVVAGYPARLINKICWVYPGKSEKIDNINKVKDIYTRWSKMRERMLTDWAHITEYMYDDIKGAKINKAFANDILAARKVNGGLGVSFLPPNNKEIVNIPGTWTYHISIDGEGYSAFKKTFGEYQEREMDVWMYQAIGLQKEQDHIQLKSDDQLGFRLASNLQSIEYVINRDAASTSIPKMLEGWTLQDVFTTNTKLIEKAFPTISRWIQTKNAPRSWLYDYACGRVKVLYPEQDNISQEAMSLVCMQFDNSIFNAMINKSPKPDKWRRLNQYLIENIAKIIAKEVHIPTLFYL